MHVQLFAFADMDRNLDDTRVRPKDAARASVLAAMWALEKEAVKDDRSRDLCSGCVPSHCYSNEAFDDALATMLETSERNWGHLSREDREYVVCYSEERFGVCCEVSGMPDCFNCIDDPTSSTLSDHSHVSLEDALTDILALHNQKPSTIRRKRRHEIYLDGRLGTASTSKKRKEREESERAMGVRGTHRLGGVDDGGIR